MNDIASVPGNNEDQLMHDSANAAQRMIGEEPAHWEAVGSSNLDPANPLTARERKLVISTAQGTADAIGERNNLLDHAADLHAKNDELSETHQMQREEDARIVNRLRKESRLDLLTGARNRNAFNVEFPEIVAAAIGRQKPLAILFADLDGFKRVNDNMSHEKGDEVLSVVGDKLHDQSRRGIDSVYRYGGDEFVVVLPDFKYGDDDIPPDKAIAIRAQLVQEAIIRAFREEGLPVDELGLGISIGGGILTPGETAQEFVKRVDRDMMVAKNERKRLLAEEGKNFSDDR